MLRLMYQNEKDGIYVERSAECGFRYLRLEIEDINITIEGKIEAAYQLLGDLRNAGLFMHLGAKIIHTNTSPKAIAAHSELELWVLSKLSPDHQQRVDAAIQLLRFYLGSKHSPGYQQRVDELRRDYFETYPAAEVCH